MKMEWLGHAGFRLEGTNIVYIDPYDLQGEHPRADIVLITHPHFDHCSRSDVEKVADDDTVVLVPTETVLPGDVRIVEPGRTMQILACTITTVPAYNTNKPYHPKENGFVGYIVEMDGERIYHAGDTDLIPEMEEIECDIALLPVSGTYVMTAAEAAEATAKMKTKKAVPMHYGAGVVGTENDAYTFKRLAAVPVEIPEKASQ